MHTSSITFACTRAISLIVLFFLYLYETFYLIITSWLNGISHIRRTVLSGQLPKLWFRSEFASAASHIQVFATFLLLAEYSTEWALYACLLLAPRPAVHGHAAVRLLHLLTGTVQGVLAWVAAALWTCNAVRAVQWPSTQQYNHASIHTVKQNT